MHIIQFWQTFTRDGRPVDWVEYSSSHMDARMATTRSRIKDLQPHPDAPADTDAVARWELVRPHYEAWQRGVELPDEGTALAVWPSLSPQHLKALQMHGLKTMEEFIALTDSALERIRLPNVRQLREHAAEFMKNRVTDGIQKDLEHKDAQIAELKEQVAALMAARMADEPAPKRGPGRPRKDEAA